MQCQEIYTCSTTIYSEWLYTHYKYLKEHVQGVFLSCGQPKGKSLHIDHTPFILAHTQPTARVYVCSHGRGSGEGSFAIIRQRGEEVKDDFIVDFKVRDPAVNQIEE